MTHLEVEYFPGVRLLEVTQSQGDGGRGQELAVEPDDAGGLEVGQWPQHAALTCPTRQTHRHGMLIKCLDIS